MTPRSTRTGGAVAAVLLLLPLAACATAAPAADAPTATAAADGTWQAAVSEAFESMLDEAGVPGGVLAVRHGGEDVVLAVGSASLDPSEPVTADTVFPFRSITKSFTVTAVLRLVDEGRVGLDDPVSTYVDGVPSGDEITLRMLAGMRSGLANYSNLPAMGELLVSDPERAWTDEELLGPALAEPLGFPPGSRYEYSNTNTLLLGRVLERVTGATWSEAVGSLVLESLGLAGITYPGDAPLGPGSAVGYDVSAADAPAEPVPAVRASALSAAGGLAGAVDALAAWGDALGTGAGLDPATADGRVDAAALSDPAQDPASPDYDGYGLGLGVIDGWRGHTGVGLGYEALVMVDPATGDRVAMLLNGEGDDKDVPAAVFRALVPLLA